MDAKIAEAIKLIQARLNEIPLSPNYSDDGLLRFQLEKAIEQLELASEQIEMTERGD